MNIPKFIREVRQEGSKVTWPSRRETMQTTMMVLVLTLVVAMFFMLVDWILGSLVKFVLGLGG